MALQEVGKVVEQRYAQLRKVGEGFVHASRHARRSRLIVGTGLAVAAGLSVLVADGGIFKGAEAAITGCGEVSWDGNPTFNVPGSTGVSNEDLVPGRIVLYDGGGRDDGKHSFGFNTTLITPTSRLIWVNLVAGDNEWKAGGSPVDARVDFRGSAGSMVRLQGTLASADGKGKFDEANRLALDISRLEEIRKYHPEVTDLIIMEYAPQGPEGTISRRDFKVNQATIDQQKAKKNQLCVTPTPTLKPADTATNTSVPPTSTPTFRPPEATASSTPVPPTSTRQPETPTASPTAERVRTQIPLPADGKARAVNRVVGDPRKLGNPNVEDGNPESNFRENVRYGEFVIISSGGIKIADEDKQVGTDAIIFTVLDGGRTSTEVAAYDIKVPDNYAIALTAQKSLPNERLINPGAQNQTALEELHGQLLTLAKEELKRGRTRIVINYYDGTTGVFNQSEFNISDYLAIEDTTPITPTPTIPATPVPQLIERLRLPIVINGFSIFEIPRPTQTSVPTPTPDAYNSLQLIPVVGNLCEDNRENSSALLDNPNVKKGDPSNYFVDVNSDEMIMVSGGYIRINGREFTVPGPDTNLHVFLDGGRPGERAIRYEFKALDEYTAVTRLSKSENGRPILQNTDSLREWYNSMIPYARLDLAHGIKETRAIVFQGSNGAIARRPIGNESFVAGKNPC